MGGVAADFTFEMLLGESDSGSNAPMPASTFVVGERKEGLAEDTLAVFDGPGQRIGSTWALTDRRLVIFRPPAPEPEGLGKILFGIGKDVAKAVSGTKKVKYGEHVEGEPVKIPRHEFATEVPRHLITAISSDRHRRKPCLRLSFHDGSGLVLLLGQDPAALEWMAR